MRSEWLSLPRKHSTYTKHTTHTQYTTHYSRIRVLLYLLIEAYTQIQMHMFLYMQVHAWADTCCTHPKICVVNPKMSPCLNPLTVGFGDVDDLKRYCWNGQYYTMSTQKQVWTYCMHSSSRCTRRRIAGTKLEAHTYTHDLKAKYRHHKQRTLEQEIRAGELREFWKRQKTVRQRCRTRGEKQDRHRMCTCVRTHTNACIPRHMCTLMSKYLA